MRNFHRAMLWLMPAVVGTALFAGCQSNIVPLKPLQQVEMWVPDDGSPAVALSAPTDVLEARPALAVDVAAPASQPATIPAEVVPTDIATQPAVVATRNAETQAGSAPATAAASESAATEAATQAGVVAATGPATEPATQTANGNPTTRPGRKVVKIIDPNETARFVYKATYDNVWEKAIFLLTRMGFALDRRDYRLGVITTLPLSSAQVVEPWKPQQSTFKNALENTINSQRRSVRLTISKVPGKPDFYEIAVQVLVERETNPGEQVGGPLFVEGSGFGRNTAALRSDFAPAVPAPSKWIVIGHDRQLEKKLLDELFRRI